MILAAKDKLSSDESQRLRELAVKIAFEISENCGPCQSCSIDGKKENRVIQDFNGKKAVDIIYETLWVFLTRGY